MARHNNDYFKMFQENIDFSHKAIVLLKKLLTDFNPEESALKADMDELHAIEHEADIAKHVLMEKLVKEFITPIEREDIIAIAQSIDDITDNIEDIILQIYIYGVESIRPEVMDFLNIITACVDKLNEVFADFSEFKKSKSIHQMVVDLNRLEEEGDALYQKTMRHLHQQKELPTLEIIAWAKIFDCLEKCCDSCEFTGDLVEEVIMKNT